MSAATPLSRIRPLRADDLAAVIAMDARIGGRRRSAFFEKRLQAALAEPGHFVYIAHETAGELTGFLQARLLEGEYGAAERIASLDNIGVDPRRQGQGVGAAMMQDFKAILGHKGVREIHTQADWRNAGFLRFLSATGFRLAPRLVLEREVAHSHTAALPDAVAHPVLESGDRDFSDASGDQAGSLARDRVSCRSLQPQDLPSLVAIDRALTGADHAGYYQRKLREVLEESGIRVSLVAEMDAQVVGFIMARVDYGEFDRTEPAAVLDAVAVRPDFAHHHVGSALLTTLLGNLAGLRLEIIRTEVELSREDVLGFLLKNGFGQSQELAFRCRAG